MNDPFSGIIVTKENEKIKTVFTMECLRELLGKLNSFKDTEFIVIGKIALRKQDIKYIEFIFA